MPLNPSRTGIRTPGAKSGRAAEVGDALGKLKALDTADSPLRPTAKISPRGVWVSGFSLIFLPMGTGFTQNYKPSLRSWSGRRESNPYLGLGKPQFCH